MRSSTRPSRSSSPAGTRHSAVASAASPRSAPTTAAAAGAQMIPVETLRGLNVNGKLTIGKGDVILRETLVDELEGGGKKVLINLDTVTTIDSSGLGELIRSKVTATSSDAVVKLLNVNIKARKLLTMAQLVGVFEMFDDEELAVASFAD